MDLISRQAVKDWLLKWEGYIDKDIIARMQYRVVDIPSAQLLQLTCNPLATDCIDRRAAIEAIKCGALSAAMVYGRTDAGSTTLSAQRWIPCSERLPEVGRSVLLSVGGMYTAEGCLRDDGDWTQFRWDAIQRKDMVGAWKPLDEPWRGEGQ